MSIPGTQLSLLLALAGPAPRAEDWNRFSQTYHKLILSWCRFRGLQAADAEDVAQDVLLRLLREGPRFDPSRGRFRCFLRAIVNNAVHDFQRRAQRIPRAVGNDVLLNQKLETLKYPDSVDDLASDIERCHAALLEDALARVRSRVKPRIWLAFVLTMIENRPNAEVAAELDMRLGTLYRYKQRVKKMVEEEMAHG